MICRFTQEEHFPGAIIQKTTTIHVAMRQVQQIYLLFKHGAHAREGLGAAYYILLEQIPLVFATFHNCLLPKHVIHVGWFFLSQDVG